MDGKQLRGSPPSAKLELFATFFVSGARFVGADAWVRLDVPGDVASRRDWPGRWLVGAEPEPAITTPPDLRIFRLPRAIALMLRG